MKLDADYGPEQAHVTPPIDAFATVELDGNAVSRLPVPSGTRLAVHVEPREGGDEWADYDDADGVPRPAGEDELPPDADAHAEVHVHGSVWTTVTLDGERRVRFGATQGDTVRVHLERAPEDTDDEVFA